MHSVFVQMKYGYSVMREAQQQKCTIAPAKSVEAELLRGFMFIIHIQDVSE